MRKKTSPGLSMPTLDRMPHYLHQLYLLKENGSEYVSSSKLGECLGIKDAQVRKDLASVGAYGRSWYGFNIDEAIEAIEKALGLKRRYTMAIIGIGNLGRALANYYGREETQIFDLVALFDTDSKTVGKKVAGHKVRPMKEAADFIRDNGLDIAVLTVPNDAAKEVSDMLVEAGVKGIYNFSMMELRLPPKVAVENARLSYGLYKLAYGITIRGK